MLILSGIAIVVLGFALRLNPLPVVLLAAVATGLAAGHDLIQVISAFGKAFNDNRFVTIPWLVLPVIGLLERYGLKEQAHRLVGRVRAATQGRLLLARRAPRRAMRRQSRLPRTARCRSRTTRSRRRNPL